MVVGRGNLKNLPAGVSGKHDDGLQLTTSRQAFLLGAEMEVYLNGKGDVEGLFKAPIKVEMEKVMKMLVVNKKMYAYLQYRDCSDGGFVLDRSGKPALTSKGLLSARRDTCRICKRTFEAMVQMLLCDVLGYDLILKVVHLVKEFLACEVLDDFKKTVEVQGSYSSTTCVNSVFKRNMLKLGTKIEPHSRVSYVFIRTKSELCGGKHSSIGDKMLLTKYFDPLVHRLDYLHYLSSGLKKSMDKVVSLRAKEFSVQKKVPGISTIQLNCPVEAILKLIASKSNQWDSSGIDVYLSILKREKEKMEELRKC